MALPQTAVGVGAIGIDPPEDALAKISTVVDIFKWLGSADVLQEAVLKSLGGGSPKLRDLVFIDVKDWNEAVASIRVDGADGARAMFPIERGHVAMVRRIARLRLGLTAIDDHPRTVEVTPGVWTAHPAIVGVKDENGRFKTRAAAAYPDRLNKWVAAVINLALSRPAPC